MNFDFDSHFETLRAKDEEYLHECIICPVVDEYLGLAEAFTVETSDALLIPMQTLFTSLVALWIVIQGYKLVVGKTEPLGIAKEIIFISIAAGLLHGQSLGLVVEVFNASLNIMGGGAAAVLEIAGVNDAIDSEGRSIEEIAGSEQALTLLVAKAEYAFLRVIQFGGAIADQTDVVNPILPAIYALVLVVPYFLALIVFFSHTVVAIFRVMMLAVFSPFLMLGAAFDWGRPMAIQGIQTLLAAFMVLFGATAALSVMIFGVHRVVDFEGLDAGELAALDSAPFLLAVAMGWLGTAFMTEATGIANSISRSSLTNTATGVITAGVTGSVGAIAGAAKKGVSGATAGIGAEDVASNGLSHKAGRAAGAAVKATVGGSGAALARAYKEAKGL